VEEVGLRRFGRFGCGRGLGEALCVDGRSWAVVGRGLLRMYEDIGIKFDDVMWGFGLEVGDLSFEVAADGGNKSSARD
jgi:hypothetical protein